MSTGFWYSSRGFSTESYKNVDKWKIGHMEDIEGPKEEVGRSGCAIREMGTKRSLQGKRVEVSGLWQLRNGGKFVKGCAKLIGFGKNVNMDGSGYDNNKSSKWNGRELLDKELVRKVVMSLLSHNQVTGEFWDLLRTKVTSCSTSPKRELVQQCPGFHHQLVSGIGLVIFWMSK